MCPSLQIEQTPIHVDAEENERDHGERQQDRIACDGASDGGHPTDNGGKDASDIGEEARESAFSHD